jgi:hypothetical protein
MDLPAKGGQGHRNRKPAKKLCERDTAEKVLLRLGAKLYAEDNTAIGRLLSR